MQIYSWRKQECVWIKSSTSRTAFCRFSHEKDANPNTFVLPPLCQALLQVQWGQVVRQVQGVHGLHWYQELPVSQAHPERREEKITKHPNEALFVDFFPPYIQRWFLEYVPLISTDLFRNGFWPNSRILMKRVAATQLQTTNLLKACHSSVTGRENITHTDTP